MARVDNLVTTAAGYRLVLFRELQYPKQTQSVYPPLMKLKTRLIKLLMRLRATAIAFDDDNGAIYHELFDHPAYRDAPPTEQARLQLAWARALYAIETRQPLDGYFPGFDLRALCRGGDLLDVGCYLGGKSVRWLEKYEGRSLCGVDVAEPYLAAANRLAAERCAPAAFSLGLAETLPFPAARFDVVLSVHTFEHVHDVAAALSECRRVLKPGGCLVVVFPPFYYPLGHHLDLVTRTPCLHWFFSYRDLLAAYFALLDARGPQANWYRRAAIYPLPFEKGYSINGLTASAFHTLLQTGWHILYDGYRDARRGYSRHPARRLLDGCVKVLQLESLREIYEVAYVLQKL